MSSDFLFQVKMLSPNNLCLRPSKAALRIKPVAAFLIIGYSLGFFYWLDRPVWGQAVTTSNKVDSISVASWVNQGRQVYTSLGSRGFIKIDVRGGLPEIPSVASLLIPQVVWNGLTKRQRIALTYYVESRIPTIRKNPEEYVDVPISAPAYRMLVNNISKTCYSCWQVITGKQLSRDNMTVDETVVQGDAAWELDKRGIKGSKFRSI